MIGREDLLSALKANLDNEEKGIPLYTLHLSNALFLSGAKPEEQAKVKEVLTRLKQDSEQHKRIYEALIDKIKREGRDVY